MNFQLAQLNLAFPEIFLLCMANLILLIDVFIHEKYREIIYWLSQLTLLLAFLFCMTQFKDLVPQLAFSKHYIFDHLAVLSKLFIFLFSIFAFAYAHDYIKTRDIARSEYYLLGLFAVLGMSVMASAYSFLMIFLSVELLSLSLYAMVAMNRESALASEAAMKYFVLGGLASGLLLYGISILYGLTGSIYIDTIAQSLQMQQNSLTWLALIFILGGLIFKFGAVPFHMWIPDVYQGAPTSVTLFIASAPKIAAFVITVRALVQAMPSMQMGWEHMLVVVAILSMFLGNLLAIVQANLKRMFAYSSIAHIGYTLLGVLAGPKAPQAYSAAMFYVSTYVLVVAGGFAIIAIMSRQGMELDQLNDYRGLNARHPWLAFIMLLLLFSMAGVPPTVGFIAKLGLLEALVQADYVWLAALAMVFALIGAYYYLRVVMMMYFEEPLPQTRAQKISLTPELFIMISINGVAALLLGLFPSFFIDLCRISLG